jgi:hypothetical protein
MRSRRKMSFNITPQEEEALKILSPRKFHRLFTLPATENHAPLKVSYSIAGPEDGDVPTILFCGGMFCTRWHNIGYEHLAQKEGVRILSIDRLVFNHFSIPFLPKDKRVPIFPISRDSLPFTLPTPQSTHTTKLTTSQTRIRRLHPCSP